MAKQDPIDRVWTLAEKIGICMLVSRDGENLRARPMAAFFDREGHAIYFLTDTKSHKDEEIAHDPHVVLAFADTGGQTYLQSQEWLRSQTTAKGSEACGPPLQRPGGTARTIRISGY